MDILSPLNLWPPFAAALPTLPALPFTSVPRTDPTDFAALDPTLTVLLN